MRGLPSWRVLKARCSDLTGDLQSHPGRAGRLVRHRQLSALVKIHWEVPDLPRGPWPVPAGDHAEDVRITTMQHERCKGAP
jgi:hypothetical protein